MQLLDIAIIGNGIAGAALALLLRRAGHQVSVFEQSSPDAAAGAGLLLQPPAIAALRAMGLDEEVNLVSASVTSIRTFFAQSQKSLRLDYADYQDRKDTFAYGIHRESLVQILRNAYAGNVATHWSTRITNIDDTNGVIRTNTGDKCGPFDLIVAADGARSHIRSLHPQLIIHDRAYKDAAIVCLVDIDDPEPYFSVDQRFVGDTHISTWPVGSLNSGTTRRLTIAMRTSVAAMPALIGSYDHWLKTVTELYPQLADLVRQAFIKPKLIGYQYRDVKINCYYSKRVVLIGDAAHAMSPQLGLGASLGLLDAWYLAKMIHENNSVEAALAAYNHIRKAHIENYQQVSRIATPFFQSDNKFVAMLRERTLLAFGQTAAYRQRALDVLCRVPTDLRE
jgi:2-polyprenyl-6-methoxyphenol hydroxylase-like FAD-dependent oxidoreductase